MRSVSWNTNKIEVKAKGVCELQNSSFMNDLNGNVSYENDSEQVEKVFCAKNLGFLF